MRTDNSYDVIVVGSGPGGATVAKEMSQRGKKVLIIEWGNKAPIRGWMPQFAMNAAVPGKSMLVTNNMLAMIRAIVTGGSSVYYYGTAFDPPVEMLQSYGIDTMSGLDVFEEQARRFVAFAQEHPELRFLMTEVGCGIAGYAPEQVAGFFRGAPANVVLPPSFAAVIDG